MNLNKVIIIGRVVADPETRSTQNGQQVTSFRVATNRFWTGQNGEKQEQTEYHSIVAWGRLSDIVSQYLNKGRLVMVEGRLQTRSWTGQDNLKRYTTEIVAENIQLGPRPGMSNETNRNQNYNQQQKNHSDNNQNKEIPTTPSGSNDDEDVPVINEGESLDELDENENKKLNPDDIPF